jgi:rare lipoprotein A
MKKITLLIYFLFVLGLFQKIVAQGVPPMDTSLQEPTRFYQEGKASYYANMLHGRRTASGERYHKNKLTAAHRTLPLGTRVRVTQKQSGHWVIVTINDRGPYSDKYIIDLSRRAAKHLGMTSGKGYTKVSIEELPKKDQPWPQKHVPDKPGQGLK